VLWFDSRVARTSPLLSSMPCCPAEEPHGVAVVARRRSKFRLPHPPFRLGSNLFLGCERDGLCKFKRLKIAVYKRRYMTAYNKSSGCTRIDGWQVWRIHFCSSLSLKYEACFHRIFIVMSVECIEKKHSHRCRRHSIVESADRSSSSCHTSRERRATAHQYAAATGCH